MAAQKDIEAEFENSVLEFSIPLYKALDKNENAFFSPYSVSAALMLLMLGTDGETKSELENALKLEGVSGVDAHAGYKLLHDRLTSKSGQGILVAVANRIFSQQGMTLRKDFGENALKYYASEVELMDFANKAGESREKINSWVEKQTRDKIKDLIPDGFLKKDTQMVLANAIYFKGDWKYKFNEYDTSKHAFFINENDFTYVQMMFIKTWVKSGEVADLNCKCLQLPYKGEAFSMVILLPNQITGLAALEDKLSVPGLQKAISYIWNQETNINIPKFKLETSYNLTQTLPKVGITKILNTSADFSGMFQDGDDDVYFSDVVHKAFVEVNEEGTEAAAATGFCYLMRSASTAFEFRADHPFLFFIRENSSGTILFMGRYAKPVGNYEKWNECTRQPTGNYEKWNENTRQPTGNYEKWNEFTRHTNIVKKTGKKCIVL